jgi:ATP-dependent Lon protease
MQKTLALDELDQKLADTFPNRVVRKDLVRQTKAGFNVPVYVLEYLLGQYCASTDPDIVAKGLDYVRETLSRNYVRADESEKFKALTRQKGQHRIIDKVKARLDTNVDHFWAELVNLGVREALIDDEEVYRYDKLLMGGIWAIVELVYDPDFQERGITRPFAIQRCFCQTKRDPLDGRKGTHLA